MLRRCISDVVALSTLSAVWAGATRSKIAESLAQVLQQTLGADVVFVALRRSAAATACDAASRGATSAATRDVIRAELTGWLGQPGASTTAPQPATAISHVVTPIGIRAEHGVIVTASATTSPPPPIGWC